VGAGSYGQKRIEVLRGPASVLYGEGGLGGVINVVPKAPQRERETSLLVGAGSYGQKRIEVLRGPASVLYGEGGLGGVINVVPKAPQRE
ncbi:TonB-dependent receptor plug domain-containing protein, partial [Burkholderia gladioli]|uniref:TonB-dependent receptor plug domain-containing protein n=1 Tax=Burkholderia gladioli TaxID=28095 RepID=UPI003DA23F68